MKTLRFVSRLLVALTLITLSSCADAPVGGKAAIGQAAPDFSLPGGDGQTHSLAPYLGKYIVLEWTDPLCPFVHKFYDSGFMQKLQQEETGLGVVWLRINSEGAGYGAQTPAEIAAYDKDQHVAATASLIDSGGHVAQLYGARTTPHMFVIDPHGTLIYAGGIDNTPSADPQDLATATNYVRQALDEARAGKPVSVPTAAPYGCGVKY